MKCEIILEDGTRRTFDLTDARVRKLEQEALEVRKVYYQTHKKHVDYGIEDEIVNAICKYADKLPDI